MWKRGEEWRRIKRRKVEIDTERERKENLKRKERDDMHLDPFFSVVFSATINLSISQSGEKRRKAESVMVTERRRKDQKEENEDKI